MRILLFGTMYCDTAQKVDMVRRWEKLNNVLNPGIDRFLVDSASPAYRSAGCAVLQLGNNIGHLAKGGRDGWGRAFCAGLRQSYGGRQGDYDYVVHVESDSLLRLPVRPICEMMQQRGLGALTCSINGTKIKEFSWVETGLMFFSTSYVRDSRFIERYDWHDWKSKKYPNTPEAVVCSMLARDGQLNLAPFRAFRDDRKVLTVDTVRKYEWVTHISPPLAESFVADVLRERAAA